MKTIFGVGRVAAVGAGLAMAANLAPGARAAAAPPRTPEQVNAQRPFAKGPIEPMRPFVLKADDSDRERALDCLAQAVYYEAAREPTRGQEAVAQVVLNRVRHPAYPKSVCGVVYQGADEASGCQFTFTCDGSLRRKPEPALWERARAVARRALAGYVDKDVGSATHYHAAYVAPSWAPTLVKMTRIGQHIFYRWTGAWGEPQAFTGRYSGREPEPAEAGRGAASAPEPRQVTLTIGGQARTYRVADAGAKTRVEGMLQPARRTATPDEVKRINDSLAALEKQLEAKAPT